MVAVLKLIALGFNRQDSYVKDKEVRVVHITVPETGKQPLLEANRCSCGALRGRT